MPSLYATDVESLSKPIKRITPTKIKVKTTPTPPPSPVVKEKKPPTEKQLANRAKFAENRKRKRDDDLAAKAALEQEAKAKEEALAAKKLAAAEKRKAKKAAESINTAVDEALEEKVEKPKKPSKRKAEPTEEKPLKKKVEKNPNEPPAWVHKFIESAIIEKGKVTDEKKPMKQVKEEAKTTAQEHWDDGHTRDRVTREVDQHMNRLYGMIFTRK
ncbi:MAG: hypothetical protein V4708_17440 [Bacteroidota bacterium]